MGMIGVSERVRWAVTVGLVILVAPGCGQTPTDLGFEVIEETEFAASLGIDLATMERRGTGVYFKDLVVGTGDEVIFGTTVTITFTGWITNGSEFDSGEFTFLMGNNQAIAGLEDGLLNARVGGTRLLVIPPNRAYGGQGVFDDQGNQVVPPGSVLIFEARVDEVIG
jgi:FKBP-type peptidyl-prolyl cis-trans isomerase FkpA